MRYIPLIVLTLCLGVTAQVTGDKSKKIYWSNECAEVRFIPLRDSVNFATSSEAESFGLTKADKCTTSVARGVVYDSGPTSMKTQELRRKSASLELIKEDTTKWRNKTVRVIGDLSIGDEYLGEFGRMGHKYYSFRLTSVAGGYGYFYMAKNTTSEAIRERMIEPDVLYADCQVRILGVAKTSQYSGFYLGGDLLSCKFWTRDEDDN